MDKPIAKPSIREENERAILAAAEAVFAEQGFGGATMAAIAARAGVPKPNMHYYFPTKERLYRAVVERVLTAWLEAASSFDTSDDPAEALTPYIGAKMDLARTMPLGSQDLGERDHARRAGDPGFPRHDADAMGALARKGRAALDRGGQAAGRSSREFLFYMIWATTQHYANAAHEIATLEARPARRRGVRAGEAASDRDHSRRRFGALRRPAYRPAYQ